MSGWTQPICEACWIERNTEPRSDGGLEVSRPVQVRGSHLEQCAWCGRLTFVGIYVRADPVSVPYPAPDEDT